MIDLIVKLAFSFFITGSFFIAPNDRDASTAKTNHFDKEGNKTGKWIYLGKDIPTAHYPNENRVMEGQYKEGKRNGTWVKYHKDGKTPIFIGNYKNNKPHGFFKKYNNGGLLIESGNFFDGKYNGTISKFYDSGTLMYTGEFYQGIENGEISHYDQNGNVALAYSSYNGILSKEFKKNEVLNNEKLKSTTKALKPASTVAPVNENNLAPIVLNPKVKKGTFNPNGYNKIYNEKDDILQDGVFKNSRLYDGKLYQYDSDGILFKVKIYRDGAYVFDGQI